MVATTPHVADFARQVGGDRVQVTQLLQPNTDPHDYEPRPSDVRAVAEADLVLTNGMGLDDWVGDVVERSGGDPRVVDLSRSLPHERGDDPHWFQDPRNVRAAVGAIRAAFAAAAPRDARAYRTSADAYRRRLTRTDAALEDCFAAVPRADRKLVTDHDAFGYFAERYGIEVIGAVLPSQTTQAQPSAGDTAKLARLIEREDVKAIFPSESLNAGVAEALADQTGATAKYGLYSDTLGPAGSRGSTYLGSLHANADAMVRGFTGDDQSCPAP